MKYIMRKLLFRTMSEVNIPTGSMNIQIMRDPLLDDYILMYLEPVND